MKYSDESYNLRINLDTENCELSEGQLRKFEEGLSPLRPLVKNFPVSDLYITVQYMAPSNQYRIKAVLQLPGRGLATGDLDESLYPAFRRCVRKLIHKLNAYVDRMSESEDTVKHEKGTRHDVIAAQPVDAGALSQAVEEADYVQFRILTYPFEEPLRKRIGRWIQRYEEIENQLGRRFNLEDMVEEVLLNAFERFDQRSREVPFGDWLENLIDPSVKLLSESTDEELANIDFARSALEAERLRRREE